MVQVEVKLKSVETDPTARMVTLIAEAKWDGNTEEIRVSEMIGNLGGLTDAEVQERFIGIFQGAMRQKIGEKQEIDPDTEKWKRADRFIGKSFTVETEPPPPPPAPINQDYIDELKALEPSPAKTILLRLMGQHD